MQPAKIADRPELDRSALDLIIAVIACSQIVVDKRAGQGASLPAGFDDIDVSVLNWIAAEGRRIGRSFARM
ncbi:MAG TPA: hypothetical protein VHW71_17355 [Steroidobacteraceae bacterium]|jgi:hypothetical protein|nr:hypothetical protein [Steroidobacteraceae bacterium]